MNPATQESSGVRARAFSLIELLAVIAVIGLLAGIMFPVFHHARISALKTRSRVQFNQWKLAIHDFHREYGYFPFVSKSQDTMFMLNEESNREKFVRVLSGEDRNINYRGVAFYRMTETDLANPDDPDSAIVDAFGNTRLALLIDGDNDGIIRVGKYDIRSAIEVVALEDTHNGYPVVTSWHSQ